MSSRNVVKSYNQFICSLFHTICVGYFFVYHFCLNSAHFPLIICLLFMSVMDVGLSLCHDCSTVSIHWLSPCHCCPTVSILCLSWLSESNCLSTLSVMAVCVQLSLYYVSQACQCPTVSLLCLFDCLTVMAVSVQLSLYSVCLTV